MSKADAIKEVFKIENYEPEPKPKSNGPEPGGEPEQPIAGEIPESESQSDRIEERNDTEAGEGEPSDAELADEFDAYDARLKKIDLDLQKQRASQKKEFQLGREAAQNGKSVDEINQHKDNYLLKQKIIDALEKERAEISDKIASRERELEITEGYREFAKKVREFGEKVRKSGSGIVGLFPLANPKLAGKLITYIGDFIDSVGNIHAAIYRAVERFRKEHPEEKVTPDMARELAQFVEWLKPPQDREPVLSLANEEAAKDILADVKSGKITYAEALNEVMNEELSDKTKGKIMNYLDWHLKDQQIHNSETLRQPNYGNKYIGDYSLTGSGETSRYLSGETLADVHGQDVQFDIDSKEKQLEENIVKDTANMIGLAKAHTGSNDALVYGGDILAQLDSIEKSDRMSPAARREMAVKSVLAVSGLNNELHGERIRIENELQNGNLSLEDRNAAVIRLKNINKMIAQAEIKYRDITSNASDVMNAARANRIYRNTYFHDLYADKILSEEQRRQKQKTEEVLVKTEVDDAIAEDGAMQENEVAEKTVQDIVAEKEKSKAGKEVASDITGETDKRKPGEKSKDKKKGLIDRLKDLGKGRKDKAEKEKAEAAKRKDVIGKEEAIKKAEEFLGGETIDDLYKKAQEQTKKPC